MWRDDIQTHFQKSFCFAGSQEKLISFGGSYPAFWIISRANRSAVRIVFARTVRPINSRGIPTLYSIRYIFSGIKKHLLFQFNH